MSKLNVPEENQRALVENALEAHLNKVLLKIVNPRRRRALHPETVHDLLVEKARRRKPVYPQFGWNLAFLDQNGQRTSFDVIKVPDEHGGRRHATYADVIEMRDSLMAQFHYEICWLRMRTAEDVRKKA